MKRVDVAVIGAGPAGSSAAICLARRGYRVALIDKEQFPREKLCGDFLNPIAWPVLRGLGVDQHILSTDHAKVTAFRLTSISGEEAQAPLPSGNGMAGIGVGLSRTVLDGVLLAKAVSEGAVTFQGCRVTELKKNDRGWSVAIESSATVEQLSARMLIAADGRNSWVARHLGLAGGAVAGRRAIGFQLRLKGAGAAAGKIEIHLFPGGYAGLVEIGAGVLNLCFAVDRERFQWHGSLDELLEFCLALNPHLKQLFRRSQRLNETRSTYPVYFPPRRAYADGSLLAGDAARVSEPVTGDGIYFALRSGELAARTADGAFRNSDFSAAYLKSYERACRSAFRTRQRVNALVRWLIYCPSLASKLIRFSQKRRWPLESLLQTICQPE